MNNLPLRDATSAKFKHSTAGFAAHFLGILLRQVADDLLVDESPHDG